MSHKTKDPYELLNEHWHISRETFERLSIYHSLLLKWQSKINLVGPDTIDESWSRHFLDSLQLMNFIPDLTSTIIDVGTGAGFPGLVLAVAGASNVHLVESDTKKIIFLREVARETKTPVTIHHNRIEDRPIEKVDVIVSRACSELGKLFALIEPYLHPYVPHGTICLFPKGKNYSKEVKDAQKNWHFDMTITPSVTNKDSVILTFSNLQKYGK